MTDNRTHYAEPLCCGIPSEPRAAGRRIARLLNEIEMANSFIFKRSGDHNNIVDDCQGFKQDIIARLRADGWRVTITRLDRWQVLPPKEW